MAKVREGAHEAAELLLDKVRDIPPWEDEPSAEQQEWWHRKHEGGGCSYPDCQGPRCYCDPDTDQAMDARRPRSTDHPWILARHVYRRYSFELDLVAPEIGDLLADGWVPNANRAALIGLLKSLARGEATSAPEDLLDDPEGAVDAPSPGGDCGDALGGRRAD